MSIKVNRYGEAMGTVTTAAVTEGRMVVLDSASETYDYGSRTDLPGVHLPVDADEAKVADYVIRFRENNQESFLVTLPGEDNYEERDGWGRTTPNDPATGLTLMTSPQGNLATAQVIASGQLALAHTAGTFTIESGMYIYSASLAPGVKLEVANTADDGADSSGKLQVGSTDPVAIVERFDTSTLELTFRQLRA